MDETSALPEPNLYEIIGRLVAGQSQLQSMLSLKDAQLQRLTETLATVAQPEEQQQ